MGYFPATGGVTGLKREIFLKTVLNHYIPTFLRTFLVKKLANNRVSPLFLFPLMHPFRLLSLGFVALLGGAAFTSQAQTCPAVTNLTTTVLSGRAVRVNATPAAGAASYIIICSIYPASLGIVFGSVNVTTPDYTFTNLPVGTPYTICINTVCALGQQGSACSPLAVLTAARNAALAEQVTLAPNPAHAAVALARPAPLQAAGTRAALVNGLGQVVWQRTLSASPSAELDLTGLAPGLYTLQLQAGPERVTKRLVVQ